MAYSAEEEGAKGSAEIAAQYRRNEANVIATFTIDMAAFFIGEPKISFAVDYIDDYLTEFAESLTIKYDIIGNIRRYRCNYRCSDNAPWHTHGYPGILISEAGPHDKEVNNNNDIRYHSDKDVIDRLNLNGTNKFSKLALSFLVELGMRN